MIAARALALGTAFATTACFSAFTDTDGIAGARDAGRDDAPRDTAAAEPKADYEHRYTEVVGRVVGTAASPWPASVTGISRGVSFPAQGQLVMLFGDAEPSTEDLAAFVSLALPASGLPSLSWSPSALKVPGIDLGRGNVPVEGLAIGDTNYVFFATGWDEGSRSYGGSALVHGGSDLAALTTDFVSNSRKHVHVSVVREGDTAFIYGSAAEYGRSPVYLAKAPIAAIGDRAKWTWYTARGFVSDEQQAEPLVDHACVGELSVRRHPRLGALIMAYTCAVPRGVLVRFAATPTGPFSAPVNVMDSTLAGGGYGRTMHATSAQVGHDDGLSDSLARVDLAGMESAAYLVPEWFDAQPTPEGALGITYTLSTYNPQTVWLMRSVLAKPGVTLSAPIKGVGLPKATLVNGDFENGLNGWTVTGSVRSFVGSDGKKRATTSGSISGDAATGRMSQAFTVDATTSRLEFWIHGGDASVSLMRGTDVVRRSWGRRSNDDSLVVWNLEDLRGETVEIVVEDTLTGAWGFVGVRGFTLR